MKIKKVFAILLSVSFFSFLFAEEQDTQSSLPQNISVDFQNKLSSNVVNLYNSQSDFDGIFDELSVNLEYGKLYAGIYGKFGFARLGGDINTWGISWVGDGAQLGQYGGYDWYVEYWALPKVIFIFSDDVYLHGSYLPVFNGNLESANMGSDFGVIAVQDGVRLGIGIDFGLGVRTTTTTMSGGGTTTISSTAGATTTIYSGTATGTGIMNGHSQGYSTKAIKATDFDIDLLYQTVLLNKFPPINLGLEYSYNDTLYFGATWRNMLASIINSFPFVKEQFNTVYSSEPFSLSASIAYTGIENMLLTGGIAVNDDGVFGEYFVVDGTLLTFGFATGYDNMELALDVATAFISTMFFPDTNNYSGYDIYAALRAIYHISSHITLDTVLRGSGSLVAGLSPFVELNPNFIWNITPHNSLSAGINVLLTNGYYNVNFPLSWTHTM